MTETTENLTVNILHKSLSILELNTLLSQEKQMQQYLGWSAALVTAWECGHCAKERKKESDKYYKWHCNKLLKQT